MKQLFIGIVLGASLTGTGVMAFTNPVEDLPLQEQVNRLMMATDAQFNNVSSALAMAQVFFTDIDERLNVIETKLKIKRDE